MENFISVKGTLNRMPFNIDTVLCKVKDSEKDLEFTLLFESDEVKEEILDDYFSGEKVTVEGTLVWYDGRLAIEVKNFD